MKLSGDYSSDGYALVAGLIPRDLTKALLDAILSDVRDEKVPFSFTQKGPFLTKPAMELHGSRHAPLKTFHGGVTPAISMLTGVRTSPHLLLLPPLPAGRPAAGPFGSRRMRTQPVADLGLQRWEELGVRRRNRSGHKCSGRCRRLRGRSLFNAGDAARRCGALSRDCTTARPRHPQSQSLDGTAFPSLGRFRGPVP